MNALEKQEYDKLVGVVATSEYAITEVKAPPQWGLNPTLKMYRLDSPELDRDTGKPKKHYVQVSQREARSACNCWDGFVHALDKDYADNPKPCKHVALVTAYRALMAFPDIDAANDEARQEGKA